MSINTLTTQYGIHWKYGDKVMAKYKGFSFECHINQITVDISFTESGELQEKISANLYGEVSI